MLIGECEKMLIAKGSRYLPEESMLVKEKSRSTLKLSTMLMHLCIPSPQGRAVVLGTSTAG